jgi:hypothetical protein
MTELAQLAFVLMLWGIIDTMFCALAANTTKPANEHKPNHLAARAGAKKDALDMSKRKWDPE